MTISEIFNTYDMKRNAAEAAAQAKHDEAASRIPGLTELERERRITAAELIGAALVSKEKKEEIKTQIEEIDNEIKTLLSEYSEGDFEPEYECALCHDTGYTDRDGIREFCPCILEKIYSGVFGGRTIGELAGSFGKFDEELFSDEKESFAGMMISPREQIRQAKAFAENYVKAYPNIKRKNVLMMGNPGLGKSFLMECIAHRLYLKTQKILYISSFELFSDFHKHRLGELDDIDLIYDADVIFLDDLGTEPMTQNVTREYFQRLLDRRIMSGKPIFIATNLMEAQIRARYGERAASRMFSEMDFRKLYFTGKDLRLI